jgi:hypothetical protein
MSEEIFAGVESTLLEFRPPYEQRASSRRIRGLAQFTLLSGLPENRLSRDGRRVLAELRRKFNRHEPPAPEAIEFTAVRSPIRLPSARKMNDEQWLKAISKYQDDTEGRRVHLRGGAYELSQVLEGVTKENPERFAKLGLFLDEDSHPAYLSAILRGLGSTDNQLEEQATFDLILHAAGVEHPEVDRWLGWGLRRLFDTAVPGEVIDALLQRFILSTDPGDERWADSAAGEEDQDPYSFGINTARGSLAEALGDLVITDSDGSRAILLVPHLDRLVSDPSVSVRTCVAHLLHALLRFDRESVLAALNKLVQGDDRLLATRPVENLLAAIAIRSPEYTSPIVGRMLSSQLEDVREYGGRLGAFVGTVGESDSLFQTCITADDVAIRKGAAEVLAGRLRWVSDRDAATAALKRLLNDSDSAVRDAAAGFVFSLRDEDLAPWEHTITELFCSPSFVQALPQLLITLERAPSCPDDLILKTARRILQEYGVEVGDISTGAAGDARDGGELVLRVYARAEDTEARQEALDLIDAFLELDAFGFADAVQGAER